MSSLGHHRHRNMENSLCEIKGCEKDAERSLPKDKVQQAMEQGIKDNVGRRVHMCKEHYKEFRKKTKTDRLTDRLNWEK